MAKIKFDVRGIERSTFYEGDPPEPGLYNAKVSKVEEGKSKGGDFMITVNLDISSGQYKGARLWHYLLPEHEKANFKWREFLDALGLVKGKKQTGVFDTEKIVGTPVQVRVTGDSYQGEYVARVGKVLPPAGDNDEDDDDDLDDDIEEEDLPSEEDDEEEEEDDDEDDDLDVEDYSSWSADELKDEIRTRGLQKSITGKATKAKMVKVLEDDDENDDDPFADD